MSLPSLPRTQPATSWLGFSSPLLAATPPSRRSRALRPLHAWYLRNMRQLLWPPKPKLLDSATSMSAACFSLPTRMFVSASSSGLSRFRLGCRKPARVATKGAGGYWFIAQEYARGCWCLSPPPVSRFKLGWQEGHPTWTHSDAHTPNQSSSVRSAWMAATLPANCPRARYPAQKPREIRCSPVRSAWMVATASTAPAAPSRWPIMDLVELILRDLESWNGSGKGEQSSASK